MRFVVAIVCACVFSVYGKVCLVSPAGDEVVPLLPTVQSEVMSCSTHAGRLDLLQKDQASAGSLMSTTDWRRSCPLVLKWIADGWEKAPWTVKIGKEADLSDARVWRLDKTHPVATNGVVEFVVPMANLEIGTRYYWQVACRGKCKKFACSVLCGCEESKRVSQSPTASFVTEDKAPRWIAVEGRVANIRDLGGRRTCFGKRVRQGMIFRGQALNDNSATGETQGPNRLTVEDVKYLAGALGIKTDLDLRNKGEIVDLKESPLGPSVRLVHNSSKSYRQMFEQDEAKNAMATSFRLFCNPASYPVYFHCIAGSDRTGTLAYILNGVLGVSRHDLETDWESTFYPTLVEMRPDYTGHDYWINLHHLDEGFARYGDANATWNERIVAYLKTECGITDEEIARFRALMLE